MTIQHKCINCEIYRSNGNQCPIFQQNVDKERGCPMYADALDPCALCGSHILGTKVWYQSEGHTLAICERCSAAISQNQCQICEKGNYCAFRQDQNCTIPPVIMRQERQGNAVVQYQEKNPARIEQTCTKCICYKNGFCMREECAGCHDFSLKGV